MVTKKRKTAKRKVSAKRQTAANVKAAIKIAKRHRTSRDLLDAHDRAVTARDKARQAAKIGRLGAMYGMDPAAGKDRTVWFTGTRLHEGDLFRALRGYCAADADAAFNKQFPPMPDPRLKVWRTKDGEETNAMKMTSSHVGFALAMLIRQRDGYRQECQDRGVVPARAESPFIKIFSDEMALRAREGKL